MNKVKNLAYTLTLALAAFAAPSVALAVGGDIISIRPVNELGVNIATPVASTDSPMQSGDEMRFAVRLLKRTPTDKPWRMHHTGNNSEVHDQMYNAYRIGIYVSGELRYAEYDGEMQGASYTDFFFKYSVKPGDFALPVVLAVGQNNPQPANSSELRDVVYHIDPKAVDYIEGVTNPAWTIDNSVAANPEEGTPFEAATAEAVMSFNQSSDVTDPDYDLRGAGYYVKTLDIEGNVAGSLWKEIPAGDSATGYIRLEAAPTNSATFYIWSKDERVAKVQSANRWDIHMSPTQVEKRNVAVIKLVAGVSEYSFKLECDGAATVGAETEVVLSGFKDFSYAPLSNEPYPDYIPAKVKVGPPSSPYMSLTDKDGNKLPSIEATTEYGKATEVKLKFNKPYDAGDVKVSFKQMVDGVEVSDADDYISNRYFSLLLDPEGDPTSSVSIRSVTMPAGETEVSFYIFGLGANAVTKSPGVTLVPDVSDQSAEIQAFFAAGLALQKNALVKLTDQVPAVSAIAPASGFKNDSVSIDVSVADNWRDLSAYNTNGYRVAIKLGGTTVLETNGISFVEGELQSFTVRLPAEGHPLNGTVQVWDATHGSAYGQAEISIDVEPALTATPVFYPDSDPATDPYPTGYFFSEGQSPYFRVNLTSEAADDMWAFLLPQNEAATNLVECSAYSNGLFIAKGSRSSSAATITFLDGFSRLAPMRAMFKVDLRTLEKIDAEGSSSYDSTYEMKSVELACVNVSPSVVPGSMEMNSTPVENGGELMSRIPVGVEVKFRARIADLSPIDLKATGDQAIVTRWQITDGTEGRKTVFTRFATNENGYVTMPFTFGYEDTVQEIKVWARDKDDLAERGDLDWGEVCYQFTVKVEESPRVILSQDTAGSVKEFSFDENVTKSKGFFYIQLSEQPTGRSESSLPISKNNPLTVELVSEAWGSDGNMVLETNLVYFTNESSDQKVKKLYFNLDTLNGGYDTLYQVSARVITSTSSNAYDQAWSEYYASDSVEISVNNIDPSIDAVKRTNGTLVEIDNGTNTCSAGESIALHWRVSDVLPDITNGNFSVSWTIDAASDSPTANPQIITNGWSYTTSGRKTSVEGDYIFTVPDASGTTVVEMTVDDGDGGMAKKAWLLYVAPTKRISVNVFGPSETSQTKYKSAKGIGQGVVAAKGTTVAPLCEAFYQTWYYAETAASAEMWAWGYPAKATWDAYVSDPSSAFYQNYTDNGKLPLALDSTAVGVPLSPRGNKWAAGAYYDWTTMGGLDPTAGDYDNYFYRWMTVKAPGNSGSGSSGGQSSENTEIAAAPTYYPLSATHRNFDLDSGSDKGNFGVVEIEAVFSREMFPKDNLGDINADYIPDQIVALYGINAEEAGSIPADDLNSLTDFNDDEDYLPNLGGSYSSLIPGLPSSWTEGKKFTARLEVRGYHDGLNDGARIAGLMKHRLEADFYSEDVDKRKAARDYSALEMLAWSLTGYAVDWTPECPSNPNKLDTDDDGFPDGYEYYFWYRAHVGDPELFALTGELRKLTGRRYNPTNPGYGDLITSAEIEARMNPRIPYSDAESAALIDTDNDGLPDLLEFELGTNPFDFDTDGDGLPDGWEIMIGGTDPLQGQSWADGKSDTVRNNDGDAMAISSYKLEANVLPKPFDIEHARRITFAVMKEDGDTDGVQWYAVTAMPEVSATTNAAAAWSFTIDGDDDRTYIAYEQPMLTAEGYLAGDLAKGGNETGAFIATDSETVSVAVLDEDGNPVVDGEGNPVMKDVTTCGRGFPVRIPSGTKIKSVSADKIDVVVCTVKAIDEKKANACWIYGKGPANALMGEVAENASQYGCLALARQAAVEDGRVLCAMPSDERDVAFIHYLVFQEFGFDPRTAWNSKSPLAKRWGKVINGEAVEDIITVRPGGYTGTATRTRDFAAYDEFLVHSFFLNNGCDMSGFTSVINEKAPMWAKIWDAFTTNPQGPNDAPKTSEENYYGRASDNGADTDGDGVPDGWELYVMAGPKKGAEYVFAPPYAGFTSGFGGELKSSFFSPFMPAAKSNDTSNQIYLGGQANDDTMNEFAEFEGTDTMAYYAAYSTTVVHDGEWKWFNKFLPTNPWSVDTDGDGINDKNEGTAFVYGTPADDGALWSIPGGGLNPCSVDTDGDGLPDPWELQYKGSNASLYNGDKANYAKVDGNNVGNALQGLTDGMDGTVKDAFNYPVSYSGSSSSNSVGYVSVDGVAQVVDRDYDHDGLDNWQEYLTGTMRCWRYDDPISPWTSIPAEWYYEKNELTGGYDWHPDYAKFGIADGDDDAFWYMTLVDKKSPYYNPYLITDQTSGSQYFTRVSNGWDTVYCDASLGGNYAYYYFKDCAGNAKIADLWVGNADNPGPLLEVLMGFTRIRTAPTRYIGCSPIDADSDHDGMDDYYELFHGMNPLLGASGVPVAAGGPCDLVYDAWYVAGVGGMEAWGDEQTANYWQRNPWKKPRGTGHDFEVFPWLNGTQSADPDGDDIRNGEEAIMARLSTTTWHHTDPTPLWMTDSSYANSLVRQYFRMPMGKVTAGSNAVELPGASFMGDDGTEYFFRDFDGFVEGSMGAAYLEQFKVDQWDVTLDGEMNWIASFEENEGFDSDHDGISDHEELEGKYRSGTDPQNFDSPRRRQAMYLQGPAHPSILQTPPFVNEYHPKGVTMYATDPAFMQYTVECWVKPDSLADSTIIERAAYVGESNPGDEEFMRCNFHLGIKNGRWYTKFDTNGTLRDNPVEAFSAAAADDTKWTHLAATYDGKKLTLYVNGIAEVPVVSGLQPAYGSNAVAVTPDQNFWFDREYPLHSILIGASFRKNADGVMDGLALDLTAAAGWDRYNNFYMGWVDEIRIWDGARKPEEIEADMNVRYSAKEADKNRSAFYDQWAAGNRRYAANGTNKDPEVLAELRFHWSFDSVFGADNENAVAKVPHGFGGGKAPLSRPEGYEISWFKQILDGYTGTVYNDPSWITWIPNTVTHLPRFDGTTLDSFYWSEDFAGGVAGSYAFANAAEPVSHWTQMIRNNIGRDLEYWSTGSRHMMLGLLETAGGRFADLYEFTGRNLHTIGDDLLPLGGAFVKYCDSMWDGQGATTTWELTGNDADNDGLPNWWEVYAEQNYREGIDPTVKIEWNTVINYNGQMITAGEAYIRDIAKGTYVDSDGKVQVGPTKYIQSADENGCGIPDWWADMYGIRGESGLDDHDNDGLPNYVEYLLSEVFAFKGLAFSPVKANSVDPYTPDYFFRIGSLYAGEIFTDHDLVDDKWEDLYKSTFASRTAYDAFADADEDGWSNRSENRYAKQSMPTVADQQTHYTAADGLVADYPIPTLTLKLNYNGNRQSAIQNAPITVQVTTDKSLTRDPDATYRVEGAVVENGGSGESSSKDDGSSAEVARSRTLGKWSDRRVIGTLTPGNIKVNSIALQNCYDPSSLVYSWKLVGDALTDELFGGNGDLVKRGTRAEYDADLRKYGFENIRLLAMTTDYKTLQGLELRSNEDSSVATWIISKTGDAIGTVNLVTGEFEINLGVFKNWTVIDGTNTSSTASMEDQTYRITYATNPSVGLPRKLYLGQADLGYVREGKNTITAWADLNGDGIWDVGEPYGMVSDVDVSWRGTKAEIELTDYSAIAPRVDLVNDTSDRGVTRAEVLERIAAHPNLNTAAILEWLNGSIITDTVLDDNSFKGQRVRVVRWLVNDIPMYIAGGAARVVLDKKVESDIRACLTEADILLGNGGYDLDWQDLSTEITANSVVRERVGNVTNVSYLVVIGEGDIGRESFDSSNVVHALNTVITRKFGAVRVKPVTVAPGGAKEEIVHSANPTFKWTINCPDDEAYTAFKIQVSDAAGAKVYDSGMLPAPARDITGAYVWQAPLYVGDKTQENKVFANKARYTWKVGMYNSKYTTDSFSSNGSFYMDVQTNGFEYGTANVAVRYFGPKSSYAKNKSVIRVRAFESPDFTGKAVAAGYVAAPDDVETGVSVTGRMVVANSQIVGIPKGSYYLQAFIDSNANGVCDKWESSGYLCRRDGSTPDYLNPTAMTFGDKMGPGDLAVIYIEDADTDGDGLPDAWEYAEYGSLTAKGVELLSETPAGEFLVNQTLSGTLELQSNAKVQTSGLAGYIGRTFANAGMVALALGANTSAYDSFAAAISGTVEPELVEGGVKIAELNMNDGKVTIKVEVETTTAASGSVLSQIIDTDGTMKVNCKVNWKATLADSVWTTLRQQVITVGADAVEIDLSGVAPETASGFYSVVIEK